MKIGIETRNLIWHCNKLIITFVIPDIKIGWFKNYENDPSEYWCGARTSAVLLDCSYNKYEYGSIFQFIFIGIGINITLVTI